MPKHIASIAAWAAAALLGAAVLASPHPARAWWAGGPRVGVFLAVPPVVVAPPVYVAPPVVYAPPPPVAYAPPPRAWVPGHWQGPYWVPGHWA